jgi:dolichyl-phosphate-mannose-protein mannosyltransferase
MLRRPWPAALAIGLVAESLFLFRLGVPSKLVFDEVHYVPAARTLWSLSHPANIEHPLLGKALIGLGIAIAGDTPWGWRILSTLAATAVVLALFAIAFQLFGRLRPAVLASYFGVTSGTVLVQARIAMLDGFMAAFLTGSVATFVWAMRRGGWGRWLATGVLLGLAVATKWTAAPYGAFLGLAFLWVRWRDGDQRLWPGLPNWPALLALAGVSVATYLATFAPAFFYADQPLTLGTLLPFQFEMFRQQTQVLPPHTYQSSWWTWPLMIRPIWYFYEVSDGAQRGILLVGNPAVLWGGLVAVAACLWAGLRNRSRALAGVAVLWLVSYLIWAVIPKSLGFFYYYYLPSIWLALALAAAWHRYGRGRLAGWDESFAVLAGGLFVWFWPIWTAAPLAGAQSFQRWMWFPTWP